MNLPVSHSKYNVNPKIAEPYAAKSWMSCSETMEIFCVSICLKPSAAFHPMLGTLLRVCQKHLTHPPVCCICRLLPFGDRACQMSFTN